MDRGDGRARDSGLPSGGICSSITQDAGPSPLSTIAGRNGAVPDSASTILVTARTFEYESFPGANTFSIAGSSARASTTRIRSPGRPNSKLGRRGESWLRGTSQAQ